MKSKNEETNRKTIPNIVIMEKKTIILRKKYQNEIKQ